MCERNDGRESTPPAEGGRQCDLLGVAEEYPSVSAKTPRAGSLLGVGEGSPRIRCSECRAVFSYCGTGRIAHRCESCRSAKACRAASVSVGCRRQRTCQDCGARFDGNARRGPAPSRCCECKTAAKKSRIVYVNDCTLCGKTFDTQHSNQRFCSSACGHAGSRRRVISVCEHCRSQFELTPCNALQRRFCSPACFSASRKIWRVCAGCGKSFNRTIRGTVPQQDKGKYCTRECYLDARWGKNRPHKKWSPAAVARSSRRALHTSLKARCRHHGVPFDQACTREAVCERDGWVCHNCGVQCHTGAHRFNKKTRKSSPRNAEHDHIVPLAVGPGSPGNVFSNSQCLCRRCNGRKGRKRGAQLLIAAFAEP